jgi:SET domain-containing protein
MTHLLHNNDLFRTPLGGFLNRSDEPNCKRIESDNKWYLETTKDINKNEELTLAYTMYNPS